MCFAGAANNDSAQEPTCTCAILMRPGHGSCELSIRAKENRGRTMNREAQLSFSLSRVSINSNDDDDEADLLMHRALRRNVPLLLTKMILLFGGGFSGNCYCIYVARASTIISVYICVCVIAMGTAAAIFS